MITSMISIKINSLKLRFIFRYDNRYDYFCDIYKYRELS